MRNTLLFVRTVLQIRKVPLLEHRKLRDLITIRFQVIIHSQPCLPEECFTNVHQVLVRSHSLLALKSQSLLLEKLLPLSVRTDSSWLTCTYQAQHCTSTFNYSPLTSYTSHIAHIFQCWNLLGGQLRRAQLQSAEGLGTETSGEQAAPAGERSS